MILDKRIKQDLVDLLIRLRLISEKETGQLVIHLNEGGITKVEKTIVFR